MSDDRLHVRIENAACRGRVLLFDMVAADGGLLPEAAPGAHVDVHLGPDLMRQYSLCGDPGDRTRYRFGVLLEAASRGGSQAVHAHVRDGVFLDIGRPRNLFPMAPDARHSVLIGGGIGVTPLVAMAHALYHEDAPFELHYVARAGDAAFADLLMATPFADRVRLHLRGDAVAPRFDPASVLTGESAGVHVYTCGPVGLMDAVAQAAAAHGISQAATHREAFSAMPVVGGAGFEVLAARSGTRVTVEADETIAAALTRAGIRIKVSCEQGICGTCIAAVMEGVPDHRDEYLTEDERADNDQIALCCSRARSSLLVLDL